MTDSRVLKSYGQNFYLPLRTGRKQYLEYDIKESRYTQEEAEDVLNQKLKIYLLDLIENKVQILHNGVTINDSGTDYVCGSARFYLQHTGSRLCGGYNA